MVTFQRRKIIHGCISPFLEGINTGAKIGKWERLRNNPWERKGDNKRIIFSLIVKIPTHPICRNPKNEQIHNTYVVMGGYNAV